jgi:plasmanylethanolamine desaturase
MLPRHDEIGLRRRIVEACCIAAAVTLWAIHLWRLAGFWQQPAWWAFSLVIAGMAAADLASGLVHWAADTWGSESMPILGRRLLHPFRVHHVNPEDLLERSFLDTNGDVALVALPLMAAMYGIPLGGGGGQVAMAFMLGMTGVGLWTNQIHQWAHMPRAPLPVRWLQHAGVILSHVAHQRHHRAPHASDYCIVSGWCNLLLNRSGLLRWVEAAITRVAGYTPRNDDASFHAAVTGAPSPVLGETPR